MGDTQFTIFSDIIAGRIHSSGHYRRISGLRKLLALLASGLLFSSTLQANESGLALTIEMNDPKARITVPGMHGIEMNVHPMNPQQPVFRLQGGNDVSNVDVSTPSIAADVSPMACASAVASTILANSPVTREQMFLGRANERTFLIIYGQPLEEAAMLNAHIVSSDASSRCIEVHVSKVSTSDADIEPWFNGFGDANIETFN